MRIIPGYNHPHVHILNQSVHCQSEHLSTPLEQPFWKQKYYILERVRSTQDKRKTEQVSTPWVVRSRLLSPSRALPDVVDNCLPSVDNYSCTHVQSILHNKCVVDTLIDTHVMYARASVQRQNNPCNTNDVRVCPMYKSLWMPDISGVGWLVEFHGR